MTHESVGTSSLWSGPRGPAATSRLGEVVVPWRVGGGSGWCEWQAIYPGVSGSGRGCSGLFLVRSLVTA